MTARPILTLALCAATVMPGCASDDTGDGDVIYCDEGRIRAEQIIEERWSDPNACEADCECVDGTVALECPSGARVWSCGRAIHRDSREQFAALVQDVNDELCPRLFEGCFGGPGCGYRPACIDGRCMLVDPSTIDAGPADAGTPDGSADGVCDSDR